MIDYKIDYYQLERAKFKKDVEEVIACACFVIFIFALGYLCCLADSV